MKKILYLSFILCFGFVANAQNFLGHANSNYSGTNGLYFNPSTLADSRHFIFVNLVGMNANFSNNYLEVKFPYDPKLYVKQLINGNQSGKVRLDNGDSITAFEDKFILENVNGKAKDVNLSFEFRLPSFMLSWNNKNTIAFHARQRAGIQINGLAEPMARLARYGLDRPESKALLGKLQTDNNFGVAIGSWTEYGATYSREVFNKKIHYLKAGLTVKRLSGQQALFIQNNGVKVNFVNNDSLFAVQTDVKFGMVREQFYGIQNTAKDNPKLINYLFPVSKLGSGYGYDFGVTYEYRPDYKKYQGKMDGKDVLNNRKNKYMFKVGAALMDMGSITYSDPKWVMYREMQGRDVSVKDTAFWGQLTKLKIRSTADVDTAVSNVFGYKDSTSSFKWGMPSSLNLNFDFMLREHVYISAVVIQSIKPKNTAGFRTNSLFCITPRVEWKWIEAAIPFVVAHNYQKFNMGAYLRLGPIYLGSDNLGGFFGITTISGFDFYFGANIPIFRTKTKDRDKDGVSDRKDRCVRVPGTWEQRGCPDLDGDGIEDDKDKCPNAKGEAKNGGCPDKDGDGIVDELDICPENAGPVANKGCPDRDNDGVFDQKDKCPDQSGRPDLDGCPDTDNDGIIDTEDDCPMTAGPTSTKGCPDTDGDGILDKEDRCPDKVGTASNKGCPDTDGDGLTDIDDKCPNQAGSQKLGGCPDRDLDNVPDNEDKCPDTYGDPLNDGCPIVEVKETVKNADLNAEEQDILKEAFDNLEFATNKSAINVDSKVNLDKLADMLKKHPTYKLIVSGHTDNVGKPAANLKLSGDRAAEVRKYIISKGVPAARIKSVGYGDTRPVSENDTEEGRQKNRRVELKITK